MPESKATQSITAPLLLLRRIRDVMATAETPQLRLDKLVQVIAEGLKVDVCSIYLLRPGDVLELYASQGLKKESVHLTRLQVGQGLVGEIAASAAPLNLADARTHEKFLYRPETGEEAYHSFAGVPIVHSDRVMGVLVAQSRAARTHSDDDMDVLQTVAMVLAELTASGKLVSLQELRQGSARIFEPQRFSGYKFSAGLARAAAVLHHPKIIVKEVLSDDPKREQNRLQKAINELQESVDLLIKSSGLPEGDERREIMETYRMFTHDRGWLAQLADAIASGLSAEGAVTRVKEQLHARMAQVQSEYIRERMQDLEDLSNRLLQILSGEGPSARTSNLPDAFILVADNLGPAELLDYTHTGVRGVVLEGGSATSHIAIIARAMEIPVVGQIVEATRIIQSGDMVVVDGDVGEVYLHPTEEIERNVIAQIAQNEQREKDYTATQHLPPVTLDGARIALGLNVGLVVDSEHIQAGDVDGVGLYRTELPYMIATDFPDVADQRRIYEQIIQQSQGKRIIFRSFDIGGDKQVPYLPVEGEENPAMGWRATRIGLDRPSILCKQFRALIQASAGRELSVMLPFIAEVAEIDACRELLDGEIARAKEEGHVMPTDIRVGAMIEIPSILFQLPELLSRVQFVSIGSNDLLQFLFACDRGTQKVADRYDTLSPIVLRVMHHVAMAAHATGVDVGFCGEMARRPLEAMALIGVGIHHLSMPHSAIGAVKRMIRSVNLAELSAYMEYLVGQPDHSVRTRLLEFAKDHGVAL